MNHDDMPQGPERELPAKRVRRLTEHAKAMLEDELPEGAGELLLIDSEDPSTSQNGGQQIRADEVVSRQSFGCTEIPKFRLPH
jgi:hypothetical protein